MDGVRVGGALLETVPELRTGEFVLDTCRPGNLRLKNAACWEGSYSITVLNSEEETHELRLKGWLSPPITGQTGTSEGRFGTPDWACTLPALGLRLRMQPPEADLPAVGVLTNPDSARSLLQEAIRTRGGRYADLHIVRCRPRIARHNPGSRCTILYDLEYRPEDAQRGWPDRVVAKTYTKDKGATAYAAMDALWATPLATGQVVTLSEPLAYLQDDRILIQSAMPEEQTLRDLLITTYNGAGAGSGSEPRADAVEDALRKTAAGLAALHRSDVETGAVFTLEGRIREGEKLATRFALPVPAVSAAAASILELVTERAAAVPADTLVPAHQSFRPAQVLLANGRIGFIDFDGFCRSEPALDVALFRASVKSIGVEALTPQASMADRQARLAHVDRLCTLFTDAYAQLAPLNLQRVALWETLDLLTNVLNPWAKIRPERLPATTFALEAHLRDLTS
jgi:hypothetical protein